MNKKDKIRLLIELSGKNKSALHAFKAKMENFSVFNDEDKKALTDQFDKSVEDFYERQISVYDRWLSEGTIDATIAFYTSDSGKEVTTNMPKITEELIAISTELMQSVFAKFTELMESKNPFEDYEGFGDSTFTD